MLQVFNGKAQYALAFSHVGGFPAAVAAQRGVYFLFQERHYSPVNTGRLKDSGTEFQPSPGFEDISQSYPHKVLHVRLQHHDIRLEGRES